MTDLFVWGHRGLIGSHLLKAGAREYKGAPRKVCNCVGFTDVDGCESHPWESYKSNVAELERLINRTDRSDRKPHIIHLSSDFIFNGENGPYGENDRPAPLSLYGAQKVVAEGLARSLPRYLIVRTTCVYGWHPKKQTFVHWILRKLDEGQPFGVTQTQETTPTYAPALANAIMNLSEVDASGVVNVTSGEQMSRFDFARLIARAWDKDESLILPMGDIEQVAARPKKGGLKIGLLKSYGVQMPTTIESLTELRKTWGK